LDLSRGGLTRSKARLEEVYRLAPGGERSPQNLLAPFGSLPLDETRTDVAADLPSGGCDPESGSIRKVLCFGDPVSPLACRLDRDVEREPECPRRDPGLGAYIVARGESKGRIWACAGGQDGCCRGIELCPRHGQVRVEVICGNRELLKAPRSRRPR